MDWCGPVSIPSMARGRERAIPAGSARTRKRKASWTKEAK